MMATVNKDFVTKNGVTAGGLVKGTRLESTVATGTAPLTVASTTAVTNLNADLLDGNHASAFATSGHTHANFVLKFDSGTTEGTDLYTYDGSAGKTVNFVGGTGITLTETSGTVTISGNPGTTSNSFVITSDSGTTEGTSKYTFDGSAAKSINFVSGTNVNIVETAGTLTFNATDTNTVTRLQGTGGSLVSGDIVVQGTGLVSTSQSGNTITIATTATNNTGTVTSVGLSLPNIFTVSNSPVTGSGTLTGALANQNANIVFAGPTTGSAAAPTFRSLVAADIPSLPYLSTSGGTVSGALTVTGDFTVQGTTTFLDTTNLQVEDKNIEIGKVTTPSDATADGGGITLLGTTNKTFNWVDSTDSWTSSEHLDLATGRVLKIAGTQVLSATQYTGNAATATTLATGRTISLSGDVTYTSPSFNGSQNVTASATIANNAVTYAKMQNVSATSRILGRVTASAGVVEELTAVNVMTILNGSTTALDADSGGTGQTSYAVGDILFASTTSALSRLAGVATGNVLISGGVNTAPSYGKVGLTTHVSGTLPVANGGTGQTTAQAAINSLAGATTTGSYLRGNGTNVVMSTIQAGDIPTLNQNTTGSAGSINGTNSASADKAVTVTTNSTPTTIDSFAVATYTTAEYLIQMKQGTKMTSTKVIITWDGTDVHVNEFGITDATAGAANATITATVATGTCTLSASSSDAATTNVVIKAAVTYIKA
jgi:hypothetical protein